MAPASQRAPKVEELVYEAQDGPQSLLISCPIEDIFFGGGRGGGKTLGVIGDWISHQDEYAQDARGVLFRRTYDELEEVAHWCHKLFPPLGAYWRAGKRTWFFPNGAELKLRYLERDIDAQRYQGHSYTWVCFDEAGNFPTPEPLDLLRACLRAGARKIQKAFRLTGNPGGVGHNWLKRRYIDPAPPMTPFFDDVLQTWRVFIPSLLEDNPLLMQNDPDYWKRVTAAAGGNKALLEAWKNGNWDIVSGGMFDDLFDRKIHVIEPFNIPGSWYIDRGFDWGSSKPFSVQWYAESDGTQAPNGVFYPKGSIFIFHEWYGCDEEASNLNTGLKMTAAEIARGIKEREDAWPYTVNPGPADPSIYTNQNNNCIADDMAAEGVEWTVANNAPGSRKNGWEGIRNMLKAARDTPREEAGLYSFETCVHWIRTVPLLPRDKKNPDDVDTHAEDHAGDNTRYRIRNNSKPAQGWTGSARQ